MDRGMSSGGALRVGAAGLIGLAAARVMACSEGAAPYAPAPASAPEGRPAWTEVRRPPPRYTAAVAAVDGRERCTAWHAGSGLLVTARHCIRDGLDAERAGVSFELLGEVAQPAWQGIAWPEAQAQPAPDIDVTFVRVAAAPVCLRPAAAPPEVGERVEVVHQTCTPEPGTGLCRPTKKISRGQVTWVDEQARWFLHDAATRPGSSGAPVLRDDGSHEVLGIHYRGEPGRNGFAVPVGLVAAELGAAVCP